MRALLFLCFDMGICGLSAVVCGGRGGDILRGLKSCEGGFWGEFGCWLRVAERLEGVDFVLLAMY